MKLTHFFQFENGQTQLAIAPIGSNLSNSDTLPAIRHKSKQKEHIISRKLLQYITPDFPFEKIILQNNKKPILSNNPLHFSLSHTKNYCSAAVSSIAPVSIDTQIITPKLSAVAPKFLHEEEKKAYIRHASPLLYLAILWTIKETLYKYFYPEKLNFRKHIFIQIPNFSVIRENILYSPEITLTPYNLNARISPAKVRYLLHQNAVSSFIIP